MKAKFQWVLRHSPFPYVTLPVVVVITTKLVTVLAILAILVVVTSTLP